MSNTIADIKNINPLSTTQGPAPESTTRVDASGSPFWSRDPNVLLRSDRLFELFPVDNMTYEEKLNAISRLVILLTLVSFLVGRNVRILIIGGITLAAIFIMYYYKVGNKKEGFADAGLAYLTENQIPISPDMFDVPTNTNPFGNVLMTDYDYNPNKRPAAPIDNLNVQNAVLSQAKQLVIDANPGQVDLADKLFVDLGDEYVFEQSLRQFNSNPATTIPNDQAAFADFCYGSMVSCKEGNLFACARNLARHTN